MAGTRKTTTDPLAEKRAAILACDSMQKIADTLGVGGKTFRGWVRDHIAHFGTDTHALLVGESTPGRVGTNVDATPVPNVERILDRFVNGNSKA